MVVGRSQRFGFFLSLAMVVFSSVLWADEVRCPVCDQSFSPHTDICPNDGTNLELRGIYTKSEKGATDESPNAASDDEAFGDGEEHSKPGGASKYKRGDVKRRRIQKKKPSPSGYSDRRSRIDSARGSAEAERKNRQQEREAFEKEDRLLRDGFEQRRSELWKDQNNAFPGKTTGLEESVAVRERLVYALGAPLTSLGFRMFWMEEGNDSGPVGSAEIQLNLARYWFRAGLSTLFGTRSVQERNDFVFLTYLTAGFQWPHRFSPFLVARGGIGLLSVPSDQEYLLGSVGFDGGMDSWVTSRIAISVSVGYERFMTENAHWDSVTYKISVGF